MYQLAWQCAYCLIDHDMAVGGSVAGTSPWPYLAMQAMHIGLFLSTLLWLLLPFFTVHTFSGFTFSLISPPHIAHLSYSLSEWAFQRAVGSISINKAAIPASAAFLLRNPVPRATRKALFFSSFWDPNGGTNHHSFSLEGRKNYLIIILFFTGPINEGIGWTEQNQLSFWKKLWSITNTCNACSKGSAALFWLLWVGTYTYGCIHWYRNMLIYI